MFRFVRMACAAIIVIQSFLTLPAGAATAPVYGKVGVFDDSPIYISAFQVTENSFSYVDIYNNMDVPVNVEGMSIELVGAQPDEDVACQIDLGNYILSKQYISFSKIQNENNYSFDGCVSPGKPFQISLKNGQKIVQTINLEKDIYGQNILINSKPSMGNSSITASMIVSGQLVLHKGLQGVLYEPYSVLPLRIVEVLPNPLLCSKGDIRLVCSKYVKVINDSFDVIDLSKIRLRNGDRNAASSVYNTSYLEGFLPPKSFAVIYKRVNIDPTDVALKINSESGATWFEDRFGLRIFTNSDTPYQKADLVANYSKSWAYDANDLLWKWTTPSPESYNNNFEVGVGEVKEDLTTDNRVPCKAGQYRSEETGRCRTTNVESTANKPCKDGQYRSEETGRCRSIAAAAGATLKPCADDQFRNPETGRCKKIASVDDVLAPCKQGYERNEETNRCRKIQNFNMPDVGYKPEPTVKQQTDFLGWMVLAGGIGLVASRGVWEWRREISRGFKKLTSLMFRR